MARGVVVVGADALAAAFNAAAAQKDLTPRASTIVAARVAATASALAPARSGRLRGSIRGSTEPGRAVISANTVYAKRIEYGWPGRPNKSRGWRGGPFGGRYFIHTAATQNQAAIEEAYRQDLEALVQQIAAAS